MKMAILSRAPRAYSTRRLKTAAEERGHNVKVLNTLRFAIDLAGAEPDLQYRGKHLSHYDAVLPRIGASITFYGMAVVRQFEQMDVYTPNTSNGIANSRDKLRAIQILSRHNIGIPATTFVRDRADVLPAIERVGGAPVVIKLLEGTQGIGVILAPDTKVAEAVIETLQSTRQNVLIQLVHRRKPGPRHKALVVGDRVVAAMRRSAQGDEFRSNLHRGGTSEVVELDPEYARVAVQSAQIMGLRVAGVDMLESDAGPLVMEVNSSPGLEGIETATDLDIAGAIVDYIANQVAFPELDVRQRLTVSTGYGVAELVVREKANLLGKSIGESGLRERDIMVLTLTRGTAVIPNPRSDRVLEVDDRLLCFGRLEEMRDLVPERRRRRAVPRSSRFPTMMITLTGPARLMASSAGSFTIAGHDVGRGRRAQFELPIAKLMSGTPVALPVIVLNGAAEGPVMWLSAAIHGDELCGVEIIRRVLAELDAEQVNGTVIAVPVVNVHGFNAGQRYLPDRRDLNRSFPGSARGSLASQIANLFVSEVVKRCSFGIDLHTGSDHRINLPQIRANLDDPATLALAQSFGAPIAIHARTRDGSLRQVAADLGLPVLLYEGGEANRFDPASIEAGTAGVMRVLASRGMIAESASPPPAVIQLSRHSRWVRAARSGILSLDLALGAQVESGEALATIYDPFGKRLSRVKARRGGIIIGHTQHPLVNKGDAVAHIAET